MKRRSEVAASNRSSRQKKEIDSVAKTDSKPAPSQSIGDYKSLLSEKHQEICKRSLKYAPLIVIEGIDDSASKCLNRALGAKTVWDLVNCETIKTSQEIVKLVQKQEYEELSLFDESVKMAVAPGNSYTESVCGADERIRPDPTAPIFEAICYLSLEFPNGSKARGTGFYVNTGNGKGAIMTAAHCLYDDFIGGYMKSISIIRSRSGSSFPHGVKKVTSSALRVPEEWKKSSKQEYDYGIILIDEESWGFGLQALSDAELSTTIATAGYPGDKSGFFMWYDRGPVSRLSSGKIYYHEDTFGGQSGSPVWVHTPGQTSATVVGVHAYGGCPNSATRITSEVIDNIMTWTK